MTLDRIQECIKLRRLVPVEPFEFTSATTPPPIRNALLTDPESSANKVKRAFIDQDDHQRTLLWTSKRDIDQVFVQEQDPNAVQQTGVFAGKRVLLGVELGINAQTKEALDQWVIMAGGEAVSGEAELDSCDVYITRWREGPGYSAVSVPDQCDLKPTPRLIVQFLLRSRPSNSARRSAH
jgi:hypothetical protein